jgi:hypothetical protein
MSFSGVGTTGEEGTLDRLEWGIENNQTPKPNTIKLSPTSFLIG